MRPILIGLAAALMAVLIAPAAASAATTTPPKPPPLDPAKHAQGMKDAPGVITASGVDCQLADARFIGESTDPKTKLASKYYELACKGSEGFIVAVPDKPGPLPLIFTCLEAAANPTVACQLPGNADPKAGLQPLLTKYKPSCTLTDARALGQTADRKTTVFEVACQGGPGYIIDASFPVSASQPATFNPCFAFPPDAANKCTLTDAAAQTAFMTTLVSKIGKPCTMTNNRYVGSTNAGSSYFEVACQEGKGYIFEQKPDGSIGQVADCAVADSVVSGGCTLTNARAAQTEQADLYTHLAQKAGFDCTVAKYFPFDSAPAGYAEVVELACSNRPDGGVLLSPRDTAQPSVFYDCAHSELVGFRCTFTKPDAALASLTKDLVSLHKTSCQVSGERVIGVAQDTGLGYVEVACADGNPGYIVSFDTKTMAAKDATACPFAKDIAGGCTMPQNQHH
jgi:hypothetical protein